MKVRDILREKGYEVVTVPPSLSVQEAMRLLVGHNIGSVVVVEEEKVHGILTERDILRLGATDPDRLRSMQVSDAMTSRVIAGATDDELDQVMAVMTENRIRHLPIVEDGWLEGIISIGDVVNALRQRVESENRHLRDYIQGRT
jgi:CBS domain-containing protein